MFKVGRVSHYYDKTKMAILELVADVAVGEDIKIYNPGREDFEQKITEIKNGSELQASAKRGETIALKVEKGVDKGAEIYKI